MIAEKSWGLRLWKERRNGRGAVEVGTLGGPGFRRNAVTARGGALTHPTGFAVSPGEFAAGGLARRGSKIHSIRRRRDRRWQMAVQWEFCLSIGVCCTFAGRKLELLLARDARSVDRRIPEMSASGGNGWTGKVTPE